MRKTIGRIRLRNPAGYRTVIQVERAPDGKVDLTFTRPEGSSLVILPPSIAARLGTLLLTAAKPVDRRDKPGQDGGEMP